MTERSVLVLAEYGWRNGGENSFLAVAPALREFGWEFTVACPADSELANFVCESGFQHVNWNVFAENRVRKSQEEIRSEILDLL